MTQDKNLVKIGNLILAAKLCHQTRMKNFYIIEFTTQKVQTVKKIKKAYLNGQIA